MTKQEAIQSAYGDAWERVKDHLVSLSSEVPAYVKCSYDKPDPMSPESMGFSVSDVRQMHYLDIFLWRPLVLDGLESNNGWIKIEEQEPEDTQLVEYCINAVPGDDIEQWSFIKDGTAAGSVTHWRRYVPHKPPIY